MRTPNGEATSEFERERAECEVFLTSDEITKSKHEDTFNASEQDNPSTREFKKSLRALFC